MTVRTISRFSSWSCSCWGHCFPGILSFVFVFLPIFSKASSSCRWRPGAAPIPHCALDAMQFVDVLLDVCRLRYMLRYLTLTISHICSDTWNGNFQHQSVCWCLCHRLWWCLLYFLLFWGPHGRFEHGLLPTLAAAPPAWPDGCLRSPLADSNDFHRCLGGTSPRKPRSFHDQQRPRAFGYLNAVLALVGSRDGGSHADVIPRHSMSHHISSCLHASCVTCAARLCKDYVYFQKTPISVGQSIVQSQIWPRAAGSDHRAVSGDVVLNRWT